MGEGNAILATARQLGGEDLDLLPLGELVPGHAHGADPAVVAHLGESMLRQVLDVLGVRLFRPAVDILVQALIGIPVIGLRVGTGPGPDFVLVHPDLPVLDPGIESMQPLGRVV